MLEIGLTDLLKSSLELSAVLSGRIFPVLLPEQAIPSFGVAGAAALTYQRISSPDELTLDGRTVAVAMIQFDIWSGSYAEALTAEQALLALLQGFRGTLSDGTLVTDALRENASDRFEPDARIFRRMNEFRIFYRNHA